LYKSGEIIKSVGVDFIGIPLVFHYGIVLVEDNETYVLHNGRERGVEKEPMHVFLKEREVYKMLPSSLEALSNKDIMLRFNHCKSRWDVLNFNCEHFIDCMTNRNRNSEQLLKIIVVSTIFILLIRKHNE